MSVVLSIMEVAVMINDETKRKLRELNLDEAIAALELQQSDIISVTLSFDERMQRLVDYLYQEKYNSKNSAPDENVKVQDTESGIS